MMIMGVINFIVLGNHLLKHLNQYYRQHASNRKNETNEKKNVHSTFSAAASHTLAAIKL